MADAIKNPFIGLDYSEPDTIANNPFVGLDYSIKQTGPDAFSSDNPFVDVLKNSKVDKGWARLVADSLSTGYARAEKAVAGTFSDLGTEFLDMGKVMYENLVGAPQFAKMALEGYDAKKDLQLTEKLNKDYEDLISTQVGRWATVKEGQIAEQWQGVLDRHPEWRNDPPENFTDLLTSPKKLTAAILESAPIMVASGLATALGQPQVGVALIFAAERQDYFDSAIANGLSREQAMSESVVYGLVAAGLEQLQIEGALKLAKGSFDAILGLTTKKIVASGKTLTKQLVTLMAGEAVEEMAQGTWQETVAYIGHGETPEGGIGGFLDRRAQEALVAAAATVGFAGGPVMYGSRVQAKQMEQARIARDTDILSSVTEAFAASGVLQENQAMKPVTKLSSKQRQVTELGDASGRNIIYYESEGTEIGNLNGLSFPEAPNTIFINKKTDDPVMQVFSHEFTHTLKQTSPELYQQLVDIVSQFTETATITTALEEIGVSPKHMADEIVAEVIGRVGSRADFANILAQRQPGLLETIVEHIKKFISSFFQEGQAPAWADAYITDLKGLQSNLEAALKNRQQEAGIVSQEQADFVASRKKIQEVFADVRKAPTESLRADNGFIAPDGKAIMFNRPDMHEDIANERGSTLRDLLNQSAMRYAKFGASATFEIATGQISQEQISFVYRVLKQNPEVEFAHVSFGGIGDSVGKDISGSVDINRLIEKIRENVEVYASRKKTLKQRIGETTGAKPVERVIETTERRLLKGKFSEQVKGAKAGYQQRAAEAKTELAILSAKKKMTQKMRDAASSMVLRYLPKDEQGKWLKRIGRIDTTKKFQVVINTLRAAVEKSEQRHAVNELKRTIKDIKAKYGSRVLGRTMLKKYGDTLRTLLDSFQVAGQTMETTIRTSDILDMTVQILETSESLAISTQAQKIYDELNSQRNKTISINMLSAEAVQALTDEIKWLDYENQWEERTIADEKSQTFEAINNEIIAEIQPRPEFGEGFGGTAKKFLVIKHSNLENLSDNTSGAQGGEYADWIAGRKNLTKNTYDKLDKGVDRQYIAAAKMREVVRSILKENNVTEDIDKRWTETLHKVTLGGKQFELSEQQIMSLYMHSRAAHNLTVLLGDGLELKEKFSKSISIDELDKALAILSKQQIAVCEQIGDKLFDTTGKELMNETSNIVDGFDIAKEPKYWPAKRYIEPKLYGKEGKKVQSTVEGMGITKQRVGVGNPLKLLPFMSTVTNTAQYIAAYHGLAPALRDVKQVVNNKGLVEHLRDSGYKEHYKEILAIIEAFEDNSIELGPAEKMLAKATGRFAKSVFGLNPKLWVRQYISLQLLSAYVAPEHMLAAKGIADEKVIAEIKADSPQLTARFEGHRYDRDIGTAVMGNAQQLFLFGSEPASNLMLVGMKYFDTNAIADVWRIATSEVKAANPSMDVNSQEFRTLRKERAEFLIRKTQPNWHIKDRSIIGSSPHPLTKSLTMFSSQRENIVRMQVSAAIKFANDGNTAKLARVTGSVAANTLLITLFNIAYASLVLRRPWPDVEKFIKDLVSGFVGLVYGGRYLADSVTYLIDRATGKPTYGRNIVEIPPMRLLQLGLSASGDLTVAAKKYAEGDPAWKKKAFKGVDNMLEAIALFRGLPYVGPKENYRGLQRWGIAPEIWPEAGQQESTTNRKGRSRRKRRTR